LLLYNKRLFQGRKLYWLIICLTQTTRTFAEAHTLCLCLPSGWWCKRSVRICVFLAYLHNALPRICESLRSLREIHKTIFYTTKTSSCCYIPFLFAFGQWELSGKIYLFILENTNCTNNTNRRSRKSILAGCYLCLSHTNQRSRKQLHEYHPDGKNSCYSPLIKKCSSRMEIRVIREIRVLLNIEILVFFGWISMRGLVWVQLSIKQRVIYIYRTAITYFREHESVSPKIKETTSHEIVSLLFYSQCLRVCFYAKKFSINTNERKPRRRA
jgi:hypothetical protein